MASEASSIGANTFQFFTRNPRGGAAKPINPADISSFSLLCERFGIRHILAHAPFTLNPCASDQRVRNFARETFADDLKRMEATPGQTYNFHPGSHVGQGIETGISLTAELIGEVMFDGMTTTVLIETMSGKGSEIGGKFEEIREIIDRAVCPGHTAEKIGVCLDTCHVFDGGYDIVGNPDGVLTEFDKVIGLKKLKAIHLNDSKSAFSSRKDRHEIIGGGNIGFEPLMRLVTHPALRELPFYLETPNDIDGYREEISRIREYAESV